MCFADDIFLDIGYIWDSRHEESDQVERQLVFNGPDCRHPEGLLRGFNPTVRLLI